MKAGLYLHVPFCRKKCMYCEFYSLPSDKADEALRQAYLSAVKKEILHGHEEVRDADIDTIYFGGGTPSMLSDSDLSGLLDAMASRYNVLPDSEISIEVNPEDSVRTENFKALGFNRLTLGVQTLNADMHKRLGRGARLCGSDELKEFFSVSGIVRGVDMIIGMPGQTEELLFEDLKSIAAFSPEHISVYTLTLDENTPLGRTVKTEDLLQSRRFSEAFAFLKSKGYIRYEVSNYALPGFYSRHNMKYWTFKPYIAFGAGAHSFYNGRRLFHKADLTAYIKNPFALDLDERDTAAAMAEFIMTGLRLAEGISVSDFFAEFGRPLPSQVLSRANREIAAGSMVYSGSGMNVRLMITEQAVLFADGIISRILQDIL